MKKKFNYYFTDHLELFALYENVLLQYTKNGWIVSNKNISSVFATCIAETVLESVVKQITKGNMPKKRLIKTDKEKIL